MGQVLWKALERQVSIPWEALGRQTSILWKTLKSPLKQPLNLEATSSSNFLNIKKNMHINSNHSHNFHFVLFWSPHKPLMAPGSRTGPQARMGPWNQSTTLPPVAATQPPPRAHGNRITHICLAPCTEPMTGLTIRAICSVRVERVGQTQFSIVCSLADEPLSTGASHI